jgi:hypothetical protein
MEGDPLSRTIRASGVLLLISLAFGLMSLRWEIPAAVALGGGWSLANLFIMKRLAPVVLAKGRRKIRRLGLLLLLKFPVLYFLGWLLLTRTGFSGLGLLIGFSLPLLILTGSALFEAATDRIRMRLGG